MRVAITTLVEYSVFSSGTTNTSIALAELMNGLGFQATLLNMRGAAEWWDDCQPLKKMFPVKHLERMDLSGADANSFDLVLEVGQLTVTPAQRKALAPVSVWVVRKPFVLSEIESSIFPTMVPPRDLEGIREAWLLKDSCAPDDITLLETMTRVRVRHVPFLWSPLPAEVHVRSLGSAGWKPALGKKFLVHMVDTNTTSSSSSTIPLVAMREAARRKAPIESWRLHNGETVAKSKFFRENVLRHSSDLIDISGQCVGRQRAVEWILTDNTLAVAHLRFTLIRPVLLDMAWVGIPIVHNSPLLKAIQCGADSLYYSNNSIDELVTVIQDFHKDLMSGKCRWILEGRARRDALLREFSAIGPKVRSEWLHALRQVVPGAVVKAQAPVKAATPVTPVAPVAPSTDAETTTPSVETPKSEFSIVFCDMWDAFQPDYNFFTLLLNAAGNSMTPPRSVKGYSHEEWASEKDPDLVIFGPFGETWRSYAPTVPRVHFTGENTPPRRDECVALNLGFMNMNLGDTKIYLRLPLWMTEINWFQADPNRLVNPIPIPLELCTRTYETSLPSRKKFCSFVVTNPRNPVRNQAFQWLSQYKHIDSGGLLYNNIGDELMSLRGGGGGECKKVKFNRKYKFALTYENTAADGYTTEKYLHAKAAGCIPIYWGDPQFQRDFDLAGCIDARNVRTPEELIELVKKVDEDDEEWKRRASVPALDSYRVEIVRRTLSECAGRIYEVLKVEESSRKEIPRFLGAAPGTPEARIGMEYFEEKESEAPPVDATALKQGPPIVTTYASFQFLGSLQQWLGAIAAQFRVIKELKAIVFLNTDVPKETTTLLEEKFPFASFEYVPTDWTPPDFSDFWDPAHYAWKLWVYHTLVNRESLKGHTILYMDAGSVLVRWPKAWLAAAAEHGVCCLEDPREENERWCGDLFCERLQVTDEERASKQIVAGLMAFVAGHPTSIAFFNEAFKHAQVRDILVGPRLSGVTADGKSYGHRQDQSILSILVRRHTAIPLQPLDTVYCDHSMRRTHQTGRSIYVHRGNFVKSVPFLPGIEDAYVINLDRRKDRLEKFYQTHPGLEDRVNRQPAFDGKEITMTPELAKLFLPNDFFWKKAVMGCALSHLSLWTKLVYDHPDIQNYLIFEDDAKLQPGWEEILAKSMAHVPQDYDVLYLGGILPPNRSGFEKVLEPVSKYYSRVKPHQFFGQPYPTRYFHSCAYAYIISRQGVMKIMEGLRQHSGYWTSADHILCSPCDIMNLYFLTPPVAGCYQDDDPVYANSDFNNFSRVDSFDSDLWNNDERFSKEEVDACYAKVAGEPFDIQALLKAVYYTPAATAQAAKAADAQTAPDPSSEAPTSTILPIVPATTHTTLKGIGHVPARFLTVKGFPLDFKDLYERDWLFSLLGNIQTADIEQVDELSPLPKDCPIVIMQRPHVLSTTKLLKTWNDNGVKFKILHLSDEGDENAAKDPLIAYTFEGCVSVLRFYVRDDFPSGTESKINVIPLGYHWSPLNLRCSPLERTPNLPFREFHWSFHGTDWSGRKEEMKPLLDAKLIHNCQFFQTWNDATSLSKEDYLAMLVNSIFVPCPRGMNPETFRFYEALEAGCIPIVLKTRQNEAWFRWVSEHIPLVDISTWEDAVRIMMQLLVKPETLEIYRSEIMKGWVSWTNSLKEQARRWLLAA